MEPLVWTGSWRRLGRGLWGRLAHITHLLVTILLAPGQSTKIIFLKNLFYFSLFVYASIDYSKENYHLCRNKDESSIRSGF